MTPTAEQQAIIDTQDGVLLVFAAVGSGKTTTIARRLARAVQDGADPRRLLALTFTNRAAEHLRTSVGRELEGGAARDVSISTFHGLCVRILRHDAPRAGLPHDFRILDEEDSGDLLRELGARAPVRVLQRLRSDADRVPLGEARFALWNSGRFTSERLGQDYVRALADRGAVDFTGLVFLARALLVEVEDCRERWSTRFDHVVVDEVQDTHPTEAEVTLVLAAHARSLCLVGDLDQTIYGWRQASPRKLIERVTEQCQAWGRPIVHLPLSQSFRSSRRLLAAADRVAAGLDHRATTVVSGAGVPEGVDPVIHAADSEPEAYAAVAESCRAAIAGGRSPRRLAVLVRTNQAVTSVARAFAAAAVPHATLSQFRFFRRPEIKDAMALATLVLDRGDEVSAHRVVQRLVQGVSPEDVYRVARDGRACGLRLTDLLDTAAVDRGDPLAVLELPEVVVLDTETTGLSPDADEVIEVAAARLRAGQFPDAPSDRFEALVRNSVPVGDSEHVHHLSDAKLRAVGRPAAQVFAELREFIGDRPVAGHNVRFDLEMLAGHGARIGVPMGLPLAYDTLPLARRLVRSSPDFRLGTLIRTLGIEFKATHRALDDVLATVALAQKLVALAREHAAERRSLVATMAPRLLRLRQTLDRWAAEPLRPPELLARIVDEALRKKYPRQPECVAALGTLVESVPPLDDPTLPPRRALRHVLDRMALLRDLDSLDADLEVVSGVRIMTVHQAKGLEFDEVHVAGLVDGVFPLSSASGDPEQRDEERRLLYVAMTRARERLHLTYWKRDVDGQAVRPSPLIASLMAP